MDKEGEKEIIKIGGDIKVFRTVFETINYLQALLTDLRKIESRLWKINKDDWEGIDRSWEMVIHHAREKVPEIVLAIEKVFFSLKSHGEKNEDL